MPMAIAPVGVRAASNGLLVELRCLAPFESRALAMTIDHFARKADSYEHNKDRVDNVAQIANAMIRSIQFTKSMHIMDFGSGTGLLLERIAPHVGKITAVDVSKSMNAQLRDKQDRLACELQMLELNLEKSRLDKKFDGIISSMTMHHIKDVPAMFEKFYAMLNDGGFVAIADLDREDGSFHSEDTGVHHAGFAMDEIAKVAGDAGFTEVTIAIVSVVHKPKGDYPVFLLTGRC
jgi:cyclopropane fatty-acyl-phospholipid synthase-like methyltransferase